MTYPWFACGRVGTGEPEGGVLVEGPVDGHLPAARLAHALGVVSKPVPVVGGFFRRGGNGGVTFPSFFNNAPPPQKKIIIGEEKKLKKKDGKEG